MSSGLNWDRARKREQTRTGPSGPYNPPERNLPTARQRRYLKQLRRERGIRNVAMPRTRADATVEIDRLVNGEPMPAKDLAADIERSVARRAQDSS